MFLNIDLCVLRIKVILKSFKTDGVSRLMLPIIIKMLLKTIISQMHVFIPINIKRKRSWRSSNIAISIEINFIGRFKCPNSNIKFSFFVKKGFLNILLNNPFWIRLLSHDVCEHFHLIFKDLNTPSLI